MPILDKNVQKCAKTCKNVQNIFSAVVVDVEVVFSVNGMLLVFFCGSA